jgi:micrococcal nuclease
MPDARNLDGARWLWITGLTVATLLVLSAGIASAQPIDCSKGAPSRASSRFWEHLRVCGCGSVPRPSRASLDYDKWVAACGGGVGRTDSAAPAPAAEPGTTEAPQERGRSRSSDEDPAAPRSGPINAQMSPGSGDSVYGQMEGRALSVLSGDTLRLVLDGAPTVVRIFGIDAPEKGQPFAEEARKLLLSLVRGEFVAAEVVEGEAAGDTLARLRVRNSDIALQLVEAGAAWSQIAPGRRDPALASAEKRARAQKVGLWADPAAVAPWAWRK